MRPRLVIDTNIVLDLFVFDDAAAKPLRAALEAGEVEWLATAAMRIELARVLGYPQIAPRLAFYRLADADVLAQFDRHARLVDTAPKAPVTCADPDDQGFIDLAVAHRAPLLSKDRAVLTMKRRLERLGVVAAPRFASVAQPA
ncbi:PIN domain protein [Xylophilus ampelinus]|nr:PIN domain-containing protein [Variovorax sp.]VTY39506.1 PIN domain protein [Xylophilus ampelinus]